MGSRVGSPNRDKVALREMAAKHGVDVVEMQIMMIRDLKKTYELEINKPRSRRSKQFFAAETQLAKMLSELTPYFQGKLSNVTVTDETPRLTVVRAPEVISDTQAWLAAYKPKLVDATPANDRPRAASPVIEQALNTLDALDQAETEIEKLMSGKKW
jgi:hypothetical protein